MNPNTCVQFLTFYDHFLLLGHFGPSQTLICESTKLFSEKTTGTILICFHSEFLNMLKSTLMVQNDRNLILWCLVFTCKFSLAVVRFVYLWQIYILGDVQITNILMQAQIHGNNLLCTIIPFPEGRFSKIYFVSSS